MRAMMLAALILAATAAPGGAQERPRELPVEKVSAVFGVTCYQTGKRVAFEQFEGPPKIELYGDFVVFSGQRKDRAPQVMVMALGTLCAMEEVRTQR